METLFSGLTVLQNFCYQKQFCCLSFPNSLFYFYEKYQVLSYASLYLVIASNT